LSLVTQRTLVLKLDRTRADALHARLEGAPFEWRQPPHSRFQVRGDGVVATLYTSGKLVVQGKGVDSFELLYLDGAGGGAAPGHSTDRSGSADGAAASAKKSAATSERAGATSFDATRTTVGSDEAGKGDYLGPLVVAAVRLTPEQARGLAEAGVADGKQLTDTTIRKLGPAIEATCQTSIVCLDPPRYNDLRDATGNLNILLADAHAEAIRALVEKGDLIVVDQFGPERLMEKALAGAPGELTQRPRAEEIAAVAAASVVARCTFLEAMDRLSEEYAVDLAKGGGSPADRSARAFVRLHGREMLGHVAKLHFKNTSKLGRV
jgi:ribonuclease HIII